MKVIKYFFEFLIILLLFSIFKVIGFKSSSKIGKIIGKYIGPFTRPKNKIKENLRKSNLIEDDNHLETTIENMWGNYGRIFAEYPFMKNFRFGNLRRNIKIHGIEKLKNIKSEGPVIFISGHFSNFELMAMAIEKEGINLSAIYRPLNNKFVNIIMEFIRKNYICKNQIKKGVGGLRDLLNFIKEGYSTALMIDQRVSEGTKSLLFNEKAYTTTIPAQLVKKFNMPVIPIFIERYDDIKFKIKINKPLYFNEQKTIEEITDELNSILEKMIYLKPEQWIWSHNRWK